VCRLRVVVWGGGGVHTMRQDGLADCRFLMNREQEIRVRYNGGRGGTEGSWVDEECVEGKRLTREA
jgi:hypothetical protein